MNIAIVTPEFLSEENFDGGLANYTYRLAKSLIRLNHTPVIFVKSNENKKVVYDGIQVHRVDIEKYDEWVYSNKYLSKPYKLIKNALNTPRFRFWEKWERRNAQKIQSYALNRQVKLVHEEFKFDIIHYASLASVGYYRPSNIPAIARISGSNAIWFEFGGYGENLKDIIKQEKIEKKMLRKMDGLFGPSRFISNMLEKKINKKIDLIESMYINEVKEADTSVYEEYLKGKKYLLFFGTISQVKGVSTLSEIIFSFLDKHKDYNFVLVGKTTHSQQAGVTMIDYLKQKAGIHKDRIIHINKISHAKLFPIIDNAEFVVLPSRIDNFPNTCIEAMAHGKIVIGTIGNGFEQLIEDKKSGYLIPVDAPEKLLQTIENALQLSSEEKKQMEEKAKKRIDLLTPENIVPQVIAFYKAAIQNFNTN